MSSTVPGVWVFIPLFKGCFVFVSISYMQCSKTEESVPKLQGILDAFLPRVQLFFLSSLPGGQDRLSWISCTASFDPRGLPRTDPQVAVGAIALRHLFIISGGEKTHSVPCPAAQTAVGPVYSISTFYSDCCLELEFDTSCSTYSFKQA